MLTNPRPNEQIDEYLARHGFGFAPSLIHRDDVHLVMEEDFPEDPKLSDDEAGTVLDNMGDTYRSGFGDAGYSGPLGNELVVTCLDDFMEQRESENSI